MTTRRILPLLALLLSCGVPAAAHAGTVALPLQSGGAFSLRVTSLQEARYAATVRQQTDYSCGSAALATLLSHHYDDAVTEPQVFDAMLALGDADAIRRAGFSMLDMKRYLQARGYEADGYEAPLAALAEAGVPALVLVNEHGFDHFVVVKGLRDGRALIGDPSRGTRALPLAALEAMRANDILFVVGNRRDRARFNQAREWALMPPAPLAARDAIDRSWAAALPRAGRADF